MEVVRSLPASDAAPGLAWPAVDLATGNQLPRQLARDLRALAGDLLTEVAACAIGTIELRVRSEPHAIRLEVRGGAEELELSRSSSRASDGEDVRPLARIDRLADRWGLAHRDGHYSLWAEKFTDRSA